MSSLNELRASPRRARKRVGRGIGSGRGKTSTRGHKGQKARSGGTKGPGFEGGQMPLQRRLPKRGFSNGRFKRHVAIINVGDLNGFKKGSVVTPEELVERRLIRKVVDGVKVLGSGDLEVSLTVKAHAFSTEARSKIETAGGQAIVL